MHFVFRTILKVARVWADVERVDLRGGALKLKCWRRFCKMPKCNQGHSFGLQHSMQGRFSRLNINNWTMGRFLLRNTAIWCQKAAQGALLSQFVWNQGGLHTTREDAKASAKSSTVFYSSRWVQVFMQHSFPTLLGSFMEQSKMLAEAKVKFEKQIELKLWKVWKADGSWEIRIHLTQKNTKASDIGLNCAHSRAAEIIKSCNPRLENME